MWQVETYSVSKLELLMLVAYCTYSATASYKVCFRSFYRLIQYRNWNYWCSSPIARIQQLHLIKYVSGVFTLNKSHLDFSRFTSSHLHISRFTSFTFTYCSGIYTRQDPVSSLISCSREIIWHLNIANLFYRTYIISSLAFSCIITRSLFHQRRSSI